MKDFPTYSANTSQGGAPAPSYLVARQQESKVFSWWYRIASPPRPASQAPFKEKERFRRGRTGSQIIPALYVLLLISFLSFSFLPGTNPFLTTIVIGGLIALTVATLLNHMGLVNLAGFIIVLTFMAYPIGDIATTPGGLGMLVLPLFGLLVLPVLCAVSFLPEWWTFVVATINIIFTLFALIYLPQTAELSAILGIDFAGIATPIIINQIIIAVVAYLWVHSTTQALRRADRAEEIAKLEHDLALQAEASSQQKHQLESSIQKIVETHMRVANGDFGARVPLTEDNVLWQISGSLNNLLSRLQRLHQDTIELQQVKQALYQAREENRRLTRKLGNSIF